MKIHLMRHYKVDFKWEKFYNSKGFINACENYDTLSVIDNQTIINIEYENIYISKLNRSIETFNLLNLNTSPRETYLINEVPINPFISTTLKLPIYIWLIMGRIQWYFNIKLQTENRKITKLKIEEFLKILEKENNDSLIIGHGFYFSQMKKILKNKKFSGSNRKYYKNGQIETFIKIL